MRNEEPEREEELPDFDFVDPLKRGDDDEPPGLDPIVTVPPDNRDGQMVSPIC